MREDVVLYHEDQECPNCSTGKLHSASGTFEWVCAGGCGGKIEKKCPCYYEKDMCRGCTYYKLCAHRPGISKKGLNNQPEGEA
jgi:hypothetical protein